MPYYVIGSKYDRGGYYDNKLEQMIQKKVVSVGFAAHLDLHAFYDKSEQEIIKYLKSKGESTNSYSALKIFLNLKPGDLIAIKSFSVPKGKIPRLVISAYAIVIERENKIYEHDPKGLGHLINVQFIEQQIQKEFRMTYGQTIHKIKKTEHISQIFSEILNVKNPITTIPPRTTEGTEKKNIEDQMREINKLYIARQIHNKIQQQFYDDLVQKHGKENVLMEKNYVDIKLIKQDSITYFEIKSYDSVKRCLREGLGQLIEYSWFVSSKSQNDIKLKIVGPSEPNQSEIEYINYLKSNLNFKFDYIPFKYVA